MQNLPGYNQKGHVMLIVIVVLAILMTMSAALLSYTASQVKASRVSYARAQAFHLAEAGLDKALNNLNQTPTFSGEANISFGNGTYTTSVSSIDPNNKQITSTGYIPNANNPTAQVTVKSNISINSSIVAFNFGVQVGAGGLLMDNNTTINGNVFSNGNITGSSSSIITGSATVAGGGAATPDQQCGNFTAGMNLNATDRRDAAQKFVPSISGPLTKISAYLKKTGTPSDITVRILTDSGNSPSKTTVGNFTGRIASSTVTTSYGWADAGFNNSPILTAGTTYWLMLDTSGSSSSYYTWGQDIDDTCEPGSTGKYSANWNAGTPVWSATAKDFNYRTYMGGIATKLVGVKVNRDARANIMENCTVGGDAYHFSINTCTVAGAKFSGTADSAPQPLPISEAQMQDWRDTAESGGTLNGTQIIEETVTMGPKKIVGDLVINGTLYLTGPIWVLGNITLNNNSSAIVDSALGNNGAVLFADDAANQATKGFISIANNATIAGNNNVGSFPLLATTKSGSAMDISNNAAGAIFYAANGTIEVANNAGGNQITGYGIHLNNNSSVTYSTGLQSATFANGPGGSWALVKGTYLIID